MKPTKKLRLYTYIIIGLGFALSLYLKPEVYADPIQWTLHMLHTSIGLGYGYTLHLRSTRQDTFSEYLCGFALLASIIALIAFCFLALTQSNVWDPMMPMLYIVGIDFSELYFSKGTQVET